MTEGEGALPQPPGAKDTWSARDGLLPDQPHFHVRECDVEIDLHADCRWADYTYELDIQVLRDPVPSWHEVFAYSRDDFTLLEFPGDLQCTLDSLDRPAKNARLTIKLPETLKANDRYRLRFACQTRIDNVQGRTLLTKFGTIFYWRADGCACDSIRVRINKPNNLRFKRTHPLPEGEEPLVFAKRSLAPKEFFLLAVTFENCFLRMPPSLAPWVEGTLIAVGGACVWEILKAIGARVF